MEKKTWTSSYIILFVYKIGFTKSFCDVPHCGGSGGNNNVHCSVVSLESGVLVKCIRLVEHGPTGAVHGQLLLGREVVLRLGPR